MVGVAVALLGLAVAGLGFQGAAGLAVGLRVGVAVLDHEPLFDDLDDATFADFEPRTRTELTARGSKTRMGDGLIFFGMVLCYCVRGEVGGFVRFLRCIGGAAERLLPPHVLHLCPYNM